MNRSEYQKQWRKNNYTKYKVTKNAWRKKNKKKIAKKVKEYAEKHKERIAKIKAEKYAAKKEFVWNYKLSHPCVDCGETDPIVLEFDHINPNEKEATVANMLGRTASLEKIKAEIDKCEVRCANCHRRKHYYENTNH